jgi:hypothetical protein
MTAEAGQAHARRTVTGRLSSALHEPLRDFPSHVAHTDLEVAAAITPDDSDDLKRRIAQLDRTGDVYDSGQLRLQLATLLARLGQTRDALHFARSAIDCLVEYDSDGAATIKRA